jgi:hypothetical protein
VIQFDEKQSNRALTKALYRLGLGSHTFSRLRRYHERTAARIIASGTKDVLLVGVEVITRSFVERLVLAGLRVHLYMWDGQTNKGRFRDYLDLLASAATFDLHDATELGMAYIPLFAEPVFDRRELPVHDIGFCGTMHSGRVKVISRLLCERLHVGLLPYYHSRVLFAAKGAVKLLPLIATKPASKAEVAMLFARSRYVLDIPHPGQTGLTARTFEALLAGSRLLTVNRDAPRLLPASLRSRVTVVESVSGIAEIVSIKQAPLGPLTRQERYFLSLRRFVDDLFRQMGHALNFQPDIDPHIDIDIMRRRPASVSREGSSNQSSRSVLSRAG